MNTLDILIYERTRKLIQIQKVTKSKANLTVTIACWPATAAPPRAPSASTMGKPAAAVFPAPGNKQSFQGKVILSDE